MIPIILLLTVLGLIALTLCNKQASDVVPLRRDAIDPTPGRYQLGLQYPGGKYSPDLALVRGSRPVQQENSLEDSIKAKDRDYSWLSEDISYKNPISWSNFENPSSPFRPGQNSLCYQLQRQLYGKCSPKDRAEIVFQGHTVPLSHESYSSRGSCSIVPFAGMRASPECCPADLSSDSGCVCGI